MHNIYFNGKAGKDCNLFASGEATFDAPEKEVQRVSIPGRNGDILISQNRYKNVTVRYPAFIPRGLKANAHTLRSWLWRFSNSSRSSEERKKGGADSASSP